MWPGVILMPILALVIFSTVSSEPHEEAASESQLPGLFKFGHFIQHFKKKYSSQLERTTRQLYFYASAFEVYVAGVAYKSRLSDHYLALNYLSDLSPREWEQMQNKQLVDDISASDETSELIHPTIPSGENPANLVKEFEAQIEEHLESAHQLNPESRRKRSTNSDSRQELPPRHVSIDMLIQPAEPLVEPVNVMAKLDRRPMSNNPQYDRLLIETMSRGLMDQQVPMDLWTIPVEELEVEDKAQGDQTGESSSAGIAKSLFKALTESFTKNLGRFHGGLDPEDGLNGGKQEDPIRPPDKMFLDLRSSGCMLQPKRQGFCGSCYAFVAITLAEWLYCKSRNKLVQFTEQYMVDCGHDRVSGLRGCSGGKIDQAAHFIHNFGLELADHYPYRMCESECPYDNKTDLNKVGFIRMKLDNIVTVPVAHWRKLLVNTPLAVNVASPPDFRQYGGGVYSGERCLNRAVHAMVVVGHGRQDGQEFWLLRNSYGTQWGEGGYWKLAKSAPDRCIWRQIGYAYGTTNARSFKHEAKMNELNYRAQQVLSKELEHKPTAFV